MPQRQVDDLTPVADLDRPTCNKMFCTQPYNLSCFPNLPISSVNHECNASVAILSGNSRRQYSDVLRRGLREHQDRESSSPSNSKNQRSLHRKGSSMVKSTGPNSSLNGCKIKIGLLNARSLKNKVNLINEYMSEKNVDIMLFTECWLSSGDPTINEIGTHDDFRYILRPRLDRKGGGVGCVYKSNLNISVQPMRQSKTFEGVALNLNSQVTILLIYRPEPSAKNYYTLSEFFEEFTELLSEFCNKDIIIAGDFNFHMNKPSARGVKSFTEVLEMFDLVQHVKDPTHVAGNTLDLVITNPECTALQSCRADELLSDHKAILIDLNLTRPNRTQKSVKYRRTKKIKFDDFRIDLKHAFENALKKTSKNHLNHNELHQLISAYDKSNDVLNKHAPEIEKVITIRKPTPWNTDDIKPFKAAKRKAEKRWRKTKRESDLLIFKQKRNELNIHLNELKRKHLSAKISNNKGNSKALFKIVNSTLHRKQDLPLPHSNNDMELAANFSNFFVDKISKIRNRLDRTTIRNPPIKNSFHGTSLSTFKPLTEDETRKLINNMAPKHCKLDPLPTWIIKECIDEFLPLITKIINVSLKTGEMPRPLKHAIIKPLLKKEGLSLELQNYRPVSNMKYLSKVIESAVIDQYNDHLSKHNLHDQRQSAYRVFHSTETLLTKIHNDIMKNGNLGDITMLVLLDLSAAFDTIDHNILLERLEKMHGIKGLALQWFTSYLQERTQSVIVNESESQPKPLKYGVPQGSKLGPILFNTYITPLSDVAKKHNIEDQKYADDEQLIIAFKPNGSKEAKTKMESCIRDIRKFLQDNKLCNNGDKTEVIILGPKDKLKTLEINSLKVEDVNISFSDKVRNLGVLFDKHMTMEKQVNKMCQTAYFNIRNISRIRNSLNKEDTKTVVNALVTPHLDYGNGLLYGISNGLLNKLQVAQNSAVRLIEKIRKRDHVTELRKNLHWLPIPARIEYKLLTTTWKILHKQAPCYLTNLIKEKTSKRLLRSTGKELLDHPEYRINNSWGTRSFSNSSPLLWNPLPLWLKQKPTLDSFKKGLKTHLFKHHYK